MPLPDAIDRYFRSYDEAVFSIFSCQNEAPSEEDLKRFESSIGFRLPEDFREMSLSPLGGLYMEIKEELWPRPEAYQGGPFWSFLYAIKVFGISSEVPEWLDIRVQTQTMTDEGYPGLVPFLQRVGDANKYCFNRNGQIVHWDHETSDDLRIVDKSFTELLMDEIHDLENRKDRKLRGEDKLHLTSPQVRNTKEDFQRISQNNNPCPKCGKPLRTNHAKQCFECGADWH